MDAAQIAANQVTILADSYQTRQLLFRNRRLLTLASFPRQNARQCGRCPACSYEMFTCWRSYRYLHSGRVGE
jgi:hypothetical protein